MCKLSLVALHKFIYWPDVKHHLQASHFLSELNSAVRHRTIQKGLPDISCKGSVTVLSEMVSRWLLDRIMDNKLRLILNLWDEMINDNRPSEGWSGVLKYSCSDSLLSNTLSENHSLLRVMEISWLLKWGSRT